MNKNDLINAFAEKEGMSQTTSKAIVDMFFDDMANTLIKGDRVEIRCFGSFKVKDYPGYTGRNPKTGKKTQVKPKKLPFFKVGTELRKRVDY